MTEPYIQAPRTSPPAQENGRPAEDVDGLVQDLPVHRVSAEYERESPPGTPRWVKGLGIAFLILILLFAGLHLTGNGGGPGSDGLGEHGMTMP